MGAAYSISEQKVGCVYSGLRHAGAPEPTVLTDYLDRGWNAMQTLQWAVLRGDRSSIAYISLYNFLNRSPVDT